MFINFKPMERLGMGEMRENLEALETDQAVELRKSWRRSSSESERLRKRELQKSTLGCTSDVTIVLTVEE